MHVQELLGVQCPTAPCGALRTMILQVLLCMVSIVGQ